MFARKRKDGYYDILAIEDGYPITRLEQGIHPLVWPINSSVSAYYEHPNGLELSLEDVKKLNIEIEE